MNLYTNHAPQASISFSRGGQVLRNIRRMVVTHVPTEDLPEGMIYWRILPTSCGSRSNNPSLLINETLAGSLVLVLSSPRVSTTRGGLSLVALNIGRKTAALGSWSELLLHTRDLCRLYDSRGSILASTMRFELTRATPTA